VRSREILEFAPRRPISGDLRRLWPFASAIDRA
jgi:hypothetical protein